MSLHSHFIFIFHLLFSVVDLTIIETGKDKKSVQSMRKFKALKLMPNSITCSFLMIWTRVASQTQIFLNENMKLLYRYNVRGFATSPQFPPSDDLLDCKSLSTTGKTIRTYSGYVLFYVIDYFCIVLKFCFLEVNNFTLLLFYCKK